MSDQALQRLREDALTMLVLWATTQEYSADIESLLKQWAGTFQIPDAELMQRLTEATSGDLQRPPDRHGLGRFVEFCLAFNGVPSLVRNKFHSKPLESVIQEQLFRTGLGHSLELQVNTPTAAAAATGGGTGGPFAPGQSNKRAAASDAGGSSKRYKTVPVLDSGDYPFHNIGPALGRKVLRYWPKDAGRNKGDPWFAAVVTDYEEDTGAHIVTYQFGTQKEEKERVSLALKRPDELRLTDEVIDLLEWYGDPKKRRKSSAVEKSVYLRKQYQALHGTTAAAARSKGTKSGKAHSNSAMSSGYSM